MNYYSDDTKNNRQTRIDGDQLLSRKHSDSVDNHHLTVELNGLSFKAGGKTVNVHVIQPEKTGAVIT